VKLYESNKLCACLKKYAYVVIIGSSHLNLLAEGISLFCPNITYSKSDRQFVPPTDNSTLQVHWIEYANGTESALNVTLSRVQARCGGDNKLCVVFIQLGTHSFRYLPVYDVMNSEADRFIDQLKAFDSATRTLDVDIVVVSASSQPDGQLVSNCLPGAFNYKVKMALGASAGVSFINIHPNTYMCFNDIPRSPDRIYTRHHYQRPHKQKLVIGDVGRSAYLGQVMGALWEV
jgi:hypothetical protein